MPRSGEKEYPITEELRDVMQQKDAELFERILKECRGDKTEARREKEGRIRREVGCSPDQYKRIIGRHRRPSRQSKYLPKVLKLLGISQEENPELRLLAAFKAAREVAPEVADLILAEAEELAGYAKNRLAPLKQKKEEFERLLELEQEEIRKRRPLSSKAQKRGK